jgi:hypothetical protein
MPGGCWSVGLGLDASLPMVCAAPVPRAVDQLLTTDPTCGAKCTAGGGGSSPQPVIVTEGPRHPRILRSVLRAGDCLQLVTVPSRVGPCGGVPEIVMPFRCLTTMDDLARWEPCGIPSTWRSPTARRPGGSPRRDRQWPRVALPPGRRVVALGGGRRDATPCPYPAQSRSRWWPVILETCLPGEGMFWLGGAAFARKRS